MSRKTVILFTFIFLFTYVSAYVFCDVVSNQYEPGYLANGVNLFTVDAVTEPGRQTSYISVDDYESLDSLLDSISMCCRAACRAGATAMGELHSASIIFTDHKYASMNGLGFAYGNYFSEENQTGGDLKAVIDRKTAWELFRTTDDVTGLAVEIFGRKFDIVGVIDRDTGFGHDLRDDEVNIYVPISAMAFTDGETWITSILIDFPDDVASYEGMDRINSALRTIGKDPDGYRIKSLRTTAVMLRLPGDILAILTGIMTVVMILRQVYVCFSGNMEKFRIDAADAGYKGVLRRLLSDRRYLAAVVLLAAAIIICLLAGSRAVILSGYYEKDPGIGSVHDYFAECLSQDMRVGGGSRLSYEMLFVISSCSMLTGLFIGLPVFFSGICILKKTVQKDTLLLYSGSVLLSITLLVIASCVFAGLDAAAGASSLLLLWLFLAVNIFRPQHGYET